MFGNDNVEKIAGLRMEVERLKAELERRAEEYAFEKREVEQANNFAIRNLEQEHRNEISDKEFELETYKDLELQKKDVQINALTQKVAVLEEKNKMLDRIIDLDSDIIDVKDLVTSLIKKLPEFNLKDITINTNSKK